MGFITRFQGLFKSDEQLRRELNAQKAWDPSDYSSYISNLAEQYGVPGGYSGLPAAFVDDAFSTLIDVLPSSGRGLYGQLRDLTLTNPFGFACIRKISESLSDIEWEAYKIRGDGSRHVKPKHPIFDLLKGRDGRRTMLSLIEPLVYHLYFGGELFVYMTTARSEGSLRPLSVDIISPDNFEEFIRKGVNEPRGFANFIRPDTYRRSRPGSIVGYTFSSTKESNDDVLNWVVEKNRDYSENLWGTIDQVLHIKRFNPKTPNRGLPLASGAYVPLIQARMAARWNTNLSKTGGRVVGFFTQ